MIRDALIIIIFNKFHLLSSPTLVGIRSSSRADAKLRGGQTIREDEMSGDVQRTRKTFAFSVESILSRDGDRDSGREGVGAKRSHNVDGRSPESKRAKMDEIGESILNIAISFICVAVQIQKLKL